MLNKKFYDVLKFIAQIALPAAGALYFGLAQIWHLPKAEEVVGTVTVVDTFLGVMLGISTSQYNKSDDKYDGVVEVIETADKKTFAIKPLSDPDEFDQKKELLFRVEN